MPRSENTYSVFGHAFMEVSRYAFDMCVGAEDPAEDARISNISQEDFYAHLYHSDDGAEEALRYAIKHYSSSLICFVGPTGAGKTTLGYKVIKDFEKNKRFKHFVIRIDIRQHQELCHCLAKGDSNAFRDKLMARVCDEYYSRIFPEPDTVTKTAAKIRLYSFLLSEHDEKTKPRNIFSEFRPYQDKVKRLKRIYCSTLKRALTMEQWVAENYDNQGTGAPIIAEIDKMINLSQLIYAANCIYDYARHIVLFDNIDALPDGSQSIAIDHIRKFYIEAAPFAAYIVAVREQNVYRAEQQSDAKSYPLISRVYLDPQQLKPNDSFPSVSLSITNDQRLNSIIEKRLLFSREYQKKQYASAMLAIESARKSDEAEYSKELVEVADTYGPPITEEQWQWLLQLSKKLVDIYQNHKLNYLTNGNLRDIMMIHRDFMAELLTKYGLRDNKPVALDLRDWILATLFYRWLHTTDKPYRMSFYNVLYDATTWISNPSMEIGCTLPYLIITCIWNLELEYRARHASKYGYAQLSDVINRTALLGYGHEVVIDTIFGLYAKDSFRGNVLEFRKISSIKEKSEMLREDYLYVMPQGKVLVSRCATTFGYLFESLRSIEKESWLDKDFSLLMAFEFDSVAEQLIPYLCAVATMHIDALRTFGSREYWKKEGWLYEYIEMFGLPLEKDYHDGYKDLWFKGKEQDCCRALQFESIMNSLIAFSRSSKVCAKYEKLLSLFKEALESLSSHKTKEFDFFLELGVPEKIRKGLNRGGTIGRK